MTNDSVYYLTQLHKLLDQSFNLEELYALGFELGINHENVPGNEKQSWLWEFLITLARNDNLHELVILAKQERSHINWPSVPNAFQLSPSLASGSLPYEALFRMPALGISFYDDSEQLQVTKQLINESVEGEIDQLHPEFARKIVRLDIKIVNKGDKPANDINIFLSIEKPFRLHDEKGLHRAWVVYGLDIFESMEKRKKVPILNLNSLMRGIADELRFNMFKGLVAEDRKKTQIVSSQKVNCSIQNKEVRFRIPKLQHGMIQLLPEIYAEFYSWDDLTSFDINFQVNADDIAVPLHGTLLVVVLKR